MKKINRMLLEWGESEVHGLTWLEQRGITGKMAYKYCQSGYLQKLGGGAYLKGQSKKEWMALLSMLQLEMNLPLHLSGKTALELQGLGHYGNLSDRPLINILTKKRVKFPNWASSHDWKVQFNCKQSTLFLSDRGINTEKILGYLMKISSRERAILELIDSLDLSHSFETVENTMDMLRTIRSEEMQILLEECRSVKVKRVFLYLAEKMALPVFKNLILSKIDLGKGKRMVYRGGVLDKSYQITVPILEESKL
jgi:hypothetical protein